MWEKALRPVDEGVVVRIEVSPGSAKSAWTGYDEWRGALRIRLDTQPRRGKANKELVKFIADTFGLQQARIQILSGEKSRHKEVLIHSIDIESLNAGLEEVLNR